MTNDPPTIHASAVQISGKGILLRGASGSGKSSIAMALIDAAVLSGSSGVLIADDRVILSESNNKLVASSPPALRGLIEVRGIGIITLDWLAQAEVHLIVDLVPADLLERYPDETEMTVRFSRVEIPRVQIQERNPDTAAIIRTLIRSGLDFKATKTIVV